MKLPMSAKACLRCVTGATALVWVSAAGAAEWGTIKGRFVYDGPDAAPAAISVTKDVEFCGKHELKDESVEVGASKGLKNVFVYLYLARGKSAPIHPDLDQAEAAPVVLDNKGCRFEPHAMVLWTKNPLEIRNSDDGIGHNTNAQTLFDNPKFNEQVTNDRPITKKFEKSENLPAKIACNVHPWMNALLLIRNNPYMAVSGEDGSFEIANVPAGKQEFIFWHEAPGYLKNLAVGKGKTDRRAKAKLDVPAGGVLDLGEVKVSAAALGR